MWVSAWQDFTSLACNRGAAACLLPMVPKQSSSGGKPKLGSINVLTSFPVNGTLAGERSPSKPCIPPLQRTCEAAGQHHVRASPNSVGYHVFNRRTDPCQTRCDCTRIDRLARAAQLFVFGCLALEPSKECCRCSRSSALLSLLRCFGGRSRTSGVLPLISSTPCRRIRLRLLVRDQFTRPVITRS